MHVQAKRTGTEYAQLGKKIKNKCVYYADD